MPRRSHDAIHELGMPENPVQHRTTTAEIAHLCSSPIAFSMAGSHTGRLMQVKRRRGELD
jgi:hypothetical protein